jgi:DNA-binding transcriptional MerR regulator
MPYKEKETTKLYYSIGEVAEQFKVKTSLIRFWEKEFDIIKPFKNKKGDRFFSPKDIDNIKTIYHLVKERGFTLDGARKKLKENSSDSINPTEIVKSLQKIRGFLIDLKEELSELDKTEEATKIDTIIEKQENVVEEQQPVPSPIIEKLTIQEEIKPQQDRQQGELFLF